MPPLFSLSGKCGISLLPSLFGKGWRPHSLGTWSNEYERAKALKLLAVATVKKLV
jgi:hypothetical protein